MYTLKYMQYISTTQLRTKSSQLVKLLQEGYSINLIHRSRVVGEIKPKTYDPKPFDPDKVAAAAKKLNLPKLSYKERERRYRTHLMDKYGKSLS